MSSLLGNNRELFASWAPCVPFFAGCAHISRAGEEAASAGHCRWTLAAEPARGLGQSGLAPGAAPPTGSPAQRQWPVPSGTVASQGHPGFEGGIRKLQWAGSTCAGRKRSARVSIFQHKQLAANKHLTPRLCKPSARRTPSNPRGRGGGRVVGKIQGLARNGGVRYEGAGGCPSTRFPSSETLLQLPTKSGLVSEGVADRPVAQSPSPQPPICARPGSPALQILIPIALGEPDSG